MEAAKDIINFQQALKKESIDRASIKDIFVEYDAAEDLIDLKISSTLELSPERASCVISLLSEALRIRGNVMTRGHA